MDKQFLYYITDNVVDDNNLNDVGVRVSRTLYNGFIATFEDVEGPFFSTHELKKNSKLYKELLEKNPRRAAKLFSKPLLFETVDQAIYKVGVDLEYEEQIFKILRHSIRGNVVRGNVSGVHFYNPKLVRLDEIIKPANKLKVFEAKISVKNIHTNEWVQKDRSTTFFPVAWSMSRLLEECRVAFRNKVNLSDKIYLGKSSSGVPIKFVFDDKNQIRSIYPIWE